MSNRIKLTPGRIESAKCPDDKQQIILRDTEQPGLGLRVTAGSKSYIFQGKLAGQVIRMTLGDVQTLTLSEARDKAAELRATIRAGRDPRIVKAERTAADLAHREKAKQAKVPAIDAWNDYMKVRARVKWSERTLLDHQRLAAPGGKEKTRGRKKGEGNKTQPGPLFDLLQRPLVEIDAQAVETWLSEQQHRPTVARFAYVRLRAFLRWCAGRAAYKGQARPDACESKEVKELVPSPKAKTDTLERQHLAAWFDAVLRLDNPVHAAYLQTVLLTGARREEVAKLQWSDVDFRWNTIRIDGKTGERIIPLPRYLKTVLQRLKAISDMPPNVRSIKGDQRPDWQPSKWVFPSPTAKSGHIVEPRLAHQRVLKLAGLPHVTIHGLRRTFGSLAEWVDLPAGVIPQIQGHAPSATTERHYRVRPIDLLAKWHNEYEAWMLAQAGIEQPQEETKLKAITAA